MPLKVVISGVEKDAVRADVIVNGATKAARRVEVWTGSAWKVGQSFLSPLTAAPVPTSAFGSIYGLPGSVTVQTNTVTATPSGGQGPYSYAWSIIAGTGVTIVGAPAATVRFRTTMNIGTKTGTAQCVVTDSLGSTATITVPITLENLGENP